MAAWQAAFVTRAQLTFEVSRNPLCDFANFETGENAEVISRLQAIGAGEANGVAGAWLWGETGSGRSHLLQATCAYASDQQQNTCYLPLAQLAAEAMVVDGLAAAVVALNGIECWLGNSTLEAALVGLYQAQLDAGGALIIAASAPAASVDFALADLASRFRALPSYCVKSLDDEGLTRVLQASARRRGLTLNAATAEFWLARSRRSLPILLAELDQLDQAALASQRRLSIPLLKSVLQL